MRGLRVLSGRRFDLRVSAAHPRLDGRRGHAVLVNGQLPAPLLRWREGDEVELRVTNELDEPTSIHWHGLLLPFHMDGVPGVSFPGIAPGETFTYRFPVRQAGTYWYHSHSGLQEQQGHYGPIVIEPRVEDPVAYDRELVVVLSDWSFEHPHRIFAKLKKMSDNYNFQQRTVGDFVADASKEGFDRAFASRAMWGAMRMNPTDIADVTAATYTYLINGHSPDENWQGLFVPGERVRLRLINASAMSIFNVRIPGLPLTVVQSDGLDVKPVEVDELQIGTAETFDVVIHPQDAAYTLMAETNDRYGYARATLAPRAGMTAAVPPLRPRPTLTMKDMAMDHGEMDHGEMNHGEMNHGEMDHGGMDHGGMDHGGMDHGGMDHGGMNHGGMNHAAMNRDETNDADDGPQRHDHPKGPGVVGLAMNPVNRLHEPPAGLEDVGHRVLVYTDLQSLHPVPDPRPPQRELELHLTSNMERYMWSFDGRKFNEVREPIVFRYGERLRLKLVNDTMMPHPIHLHGMFFELVTDTDPSHRPRKHTVVVKPGEKMAVDLTADAPGDWVFHCHLLYHMHAGMMRVVSVRETV